MDRRAFLLAALGASVAKEASAARMYIGTAAYVPGWESRYFRPHELASHGNHRVRVTVDLVTALDRVRHDYGLPIRILSGYRDPDWNARIGGARRSRHLICDAVDIDIAPYSVQARYALMTQLISNGFTSFGSYRNKPNLLHTDRRAWAAVWHYGGGSRPRWLNQALNEWKWHPGTGSPYR
ncbi:MAG: D-Ala-D-Ala carboxypeptidase family metallohydrolase [Pseudomonadota bacterium]